MVIAKRDRDDGFVLQVGDDRGRGRCGSVNVPLEDDRLFLMRVCDEVPEVSCDLRVGDA